ncbi:NYN domain-containing protein [Mycobacterium shimoidei]|uniref:NYN domain-containing protein n=1 Tax=Mycobacterium shimoidei TaxID=29313 RepID=UPI000848A4D5|nr:NYN domain-containing protein [Mycobacterium shimoidei]MCV7260885.1 NYN domain-containing protein [Mycobacterium shimoidei]ODR04049.1 RNA-binding protein [Mycobacterium shimoidei]ORW78455.1 RNA-binding protein [Mycobacterium shimoidei]
MRWIVDGMNVIGSRPDGWWQDRSAAMVALVESLDRWAAVNGERVTVVFERPLAISSVVVEVAFAPAAGATSADDEIVRLVGVDSRPEEICVVTSDKGLTMRVRGLGAVVHPAQGFRDLVERLYR